jgi:hypothetical protein
MRAHLCSKNPDAFEIEFFDSFCEKLLASQQPQGHAVGLLRHGIGCAGLHSVACADGLPDLEAIRISVIDPVEDSDARGTLPELAVHLIAELAWKIEEVDRYCDLLLQ